MRKGKILIMDDEEIVQDVLSNMLDFLGYEAEVTGDGAQAIERFKQALLSDNPFDAIIMDLTIPGGVGGRDAIQDLLVLDPEVKAIVSSGYSTDPVVTNYQDYGFKGVVNKPFKIEDLRQVLEQLV